MHASVSSLAANDLGQRDATDVRPRPQLLGHSELGPNPGVALRASAQTLGVEQHRVGDLAS
jgi:hypothetical protein